MIVVSMKVAPTHCTLRDQIVLTEFEEESIFVRFPGFPEPSVFSNWIISKLFQMTPRICPPCNDMITTC